MHLAVLTLEVDADARWALDALGTGLTSRTFRTLQTRGTLLALGALNTRAALRPGGALRTAD